LAALLEIQRQQRLLTLCSTVLQGFGEVQSLFMGVGDWPTIQGTAQLLRSVLADPAAAYETLQDRGIAHGDLLKAIRRLGTVACCIFSEGW